MKRQVLDRWRAMLTSGLGTTYDPETGRVREWYVLDGVRRWAGDDTPCDPEKPDAGTEGRCDG